MHHHGADGECHPGPGGIFGCKRCEEDRDEEEDEEEEEGSRRAGSLRETAYLLRSPANARRLLASISRLENDGGTDRRLRP